MNIYFSSFDDVNNPYYGGGGSIAVHEVAKRLAKKHTVTVITGKYPHSKNEIRDGVYYRRIGFSLFGPRISQLIYQILLPFQLHDKKFDIWVESFTPPFSCAFLPLFTKRPVIGLTHLLGGKHMSKKYNLPFILIENFSLHFYRFFITMTNELKEQINQQNTGAETTVIPNGISVEKFNTSVTMNKKHILFIGRLDIYQKGLDILIDAYKKSEKELRYPLVIAGYGSKQEIEKIKEKIAYYQLETKVKYLGKITGERKKKLFLESILTIVPSRFESFGLTILEGFHYGSVIITFDIPDLRWIPNDYCKKIIPFDSAALGNAMVDLLTNKKNRERYIKKAQKFVKQFNWDNCTSQYERLLTKIYETTL